LKNFYSKQTGYNYAAIEEMKKIFIEDITCSLENYFLALSFTISLLNSNKTPAFAAGEKVQK
jgi:hypothetical protein